MGAKRYRAKLVTGKSHIGPDDDHEEGDEDADVDEGLEAQLLHPKEFTCTTSYA